MSFWRDFVRSFHRRRKIQAAPVQGMNLSRFSMQSQYTLSTIEVRNDLKDMLRRLSSCESYGVKLLTESQERRHCWGLFLLMILPLITLIVASLNNLSVDIGQKRHLNSMQISFENLNLSNELAAVLADEMKATVDKIYYESTEIKHTVAMTQKQTDDFLMFAARWPFHVCSDWKALETKDNLFQYLENYRIHTRRKAKSFAELETFQMLEDKLAACSMILLQGDSSLENSNPRWPEMANIGHVLASNIRLRFIVHKLTFCSRFPELELPVSMFSLHSHLELVRFFINRNKSIAAQNAQCKSLSLKQYVDEYNVSMCSDKHVQSERERLELAIGCFQSLLTEMMGSSAHENRQLNMWIAINAISVAVSVFLCIPMLFLLIIISYRLRAIFTESLRSVSRNLDAQNTLVSNVLQEVIPRPFGSSVHFIANKKVSNQPNYFKDAVVLVLYTYEIFRLIPSRDPKNVLLMINEILTLLDDRISLYKIDYVKKSTFYYSLFIGLDGKKGTSKVSEMANLALDLIISCSDLEMGVLENPKVDLRIGLHCGPVIGSFIKSYGCDRFTVVGKTLERTYNLAKSCQPNSVHISSAAEKDLVDSGLYDTQKRVSISNSDNKVETYWLLGRRVSTDIRNGKKTTVQNSIREPLDLSKKAYYVFDPDNLYILPSSHSFW